MFAALGRAIAEEPANERLLDQVDRLAGELQHYDELVALTEEILIGEISSDGTKVLGLRTAGWYSGKLNNIEKERSK